MHNPKSSPTDGVGFATPCNQIARIDLSMAIDAFYLKRYPSAFKDGHKKVSYKLGAVNTERVVLCKEVICDFFDAAARRKAIELSAPRGETCVREPNKPHTLSLKLNHRVTNGTNFGIACTGYVLAYDASASIDYTDDEQLIATTGFLAMSVEVFKQQLPTRQRDGYVYRMGNRGMGYYLDVALAAVPEGGIPLYVGSPALNIEVVGLEYPVISFGPHNKMPPRYVQQHRTIGFKVNDRLVSINGASTLQKDNQWVHEQLTLFYNTQKLLRVQNTVLLQDNRIKIKPVTAVCETHRSVVIDGTVHSHSLGTYNPKCSLSRNPFNKQVIKNLVKRSKKNDKKFQTDTCEHKRIIQLDIVIDRFVQDLDNLIKTSKIPGKLTGESTTYRKVMNILSETMQLRRENGYNVTTSKKELYKQEREQKQSERQKTKTKQREEVQVDMINLETRWQKLHALQIRMENLDQSNQLQSSNDVDDAELLRLLKEKVKDEQNKIFCNLEIAINERKKALQDE